MTDNNHNIIHPPKKRKAEDHQALVRALGKVDAKTDLGKYARDMLVWDEVLLNELLVAVQSKEVVKEMLNRRSINLKSKKEVSTATALMAIVSSKWIDSGGVLDGYAADEIIEVSRLKDTVARFVPDLAKLWKSLAKKIWTVDVSSDFDPIKINNSFHLASASWSKLPREWIPKLYTIEDSGKKLSYAAFAGASGSGKTSAMIYATKELVEPWVPGQMNK